MKKQNQPNCTPYNSDFSLAVARIAIAQICEGLGFRKFQQSALNTFSDVAVKYITQIGRISTFRANLANRIDSNVFDIIQGLEDLGSIQGFSNASDIGHSQSILRLGVVRDVMRYVRVSEEIPFAYLVPRFPIAKDRKLDTGLVRCPIGKGCVPSWLPKFPDPETCTELVSEKRSLRCVRFGEEVNVKERGACFAPAVCYREKEVSVPVVPDKLVSGDVTGNVKSCEISENCVSAVESLLLGNETEDRRKLVRDGRSSVRFKFGNGEKSLGMKRRFRIGGFEKSSLWFTDDDDDNGGKDEMKRKRKAEQIFREKVDCSQEATHLYISELGIEETV